MSWSSSINISACTGWKRFAGALLCIAVAAPATLQSSSAGDDLATTIGDLQPVIVKLYGPGGGNLDSYGTGVLVSAEGHVLTVWNHLVNSGYLTATTADGRRFDTELSGVSGDHDLAVLKLLAEEGTEFPHVDITKFQEIEAGTPILSFSNMFRVAAGTEPVSVVHGVIAAKAPLEAGLGRWEFPLREPVYILDAVTNNSGAAGGLLTTWDGQPVGLIGREIRNRRTGTWVNYAVPLSPLRTILDELIAGRSIASSAASEPEGMLSDREITQRLGLTLLPSVVETTPAYVDAVNPDSQAGATALRAGDLIVLVDGNVVRSVNDFRRLVHGFRVGQPFTVTFQRDGALQEASLKLLPKP